ncbi:hypothetical protein C8R46DRAFT_1231825 [Mycena filopes]|nr:hypothetical protein C8R46DRAFT_1231825 [Mycena filopes]
MNSAADAFPGGDIVCRQMSPGSALLLLQPSPSQSPLSFAAGTTPISVQTSLAAAIECVRDPQRRRAAALTSSPTRHHLTPTARTYQPTASPQTSITICIEVPRPRVRFLKSFWPPAGTSCLDSQDFVIDKGLLQVGTAEAPRSGADLLTNMPSSAAYREDIPAHRVAATVDYYMYRRPATLSLVRIPPPTRVAPHVLSPVHLLSFFEIFWPPAGTSHLDAQNSVPDASPAESVFLVRRGAAQRRQPRILYGSTSAERGFAFG